MMVKVIGYFHNHVQKKLYILLIGWKKTFFTENELFSYFRDIC